MRRPFLIDTDTASDDAVALIMALRSPDVDVKAITVVAGNVPVEQGVRNALYTAELCSSDVPVHAGAARPLLRQLCDARWFHGHDGLGDSNYPASRRKPARVHAVDAICEVARKTSDLTLVTLGPLTNMALALARDPGIAKNISRCVIMGGNPGCCGNVTPAAEFNMWVDPEAARMVFHAGLPIEMVGWQLSREPAALDPTNISRIRDLNNPLADFAIDCNCRAMEAFKAQTGEIGIALPDPVNMAVALDPTIATDKGEHWVEIDTASELTRGMTLVDRLNVAADDRNRVAWSAALAARKSTVIWKIDVDRWKQLLYRLLQS